MAGYSGTPLPKKLGIKEGARIALLSKPRAFSLGALPPLVIEKSDLRGKDPLDVILLFVTSRADLEKRFAGARDRIAKNGGLWVCWPKKASRVETDMTEDVARKVGIAGGLVDNKVCAVDETWSGLRLVWRVADR
jgi:hypothetical protein